MQKAVIEAVKEVGRLVFFGAIAIVVAWGQSKLTGVDPDSVVFLVGTLVLRFLDKFVHENEDIKANGLSGF